MVLGTRPVVAFVRCPRRCQDDGPPTGGTLRRAKCIQDFALADSVMDRRPCADHIPTAGCLSGVLTFLNKIFPKQKEQPRTGPDLTAERKKRNRILRKIFAEVAVLRAHARQVEIKDL